MLKLRELAEELRQRTWAVDCPEMKLGRPAAPGPTEYVGPGYLRQEADGAVTYKLYPPPPAASDPRSDSPRIGVAGRILGDDFFYRLDATDKGGTVWHVERTLPVPDTSFVGGRQFRLVTGTAPELVTSRPQPQSVSSLTMMFLTEARVPGNASTEITTVTPDGSVSRSTRLDTAQFKTAAGDFHIYNRPGMLVVEVVSPGPFPAHFDTRVVEALGFVLAKPVLWNVLELVENGVETVRVRGAVEVIDAKFQPPVVSGTIDLSGGDVWRLFDKYLAMVCSHPGPDFHPASRHVFSVLEASAGPVSARGLALGVAVEFRHKSWWNEGVYAAFRAAGAVFCSVSGTRLPDELVKTAADVYVRFHGTKRWYRHGYTKAELAVWAERIRVSGAKRVWAHFNNDRDGHAVTNARELLRLLRPR